MQLTKTCLLGAIIAVLPLLLHPVLAQPPRPHLQAYHLSPPSEAQASPASQEPAKVGSPIFEGGF